MTKLNILIVEDRQENIDAARKFFDTRQELKVDFAQTYQEAIRQLEEKVYAGAILDIHFPREPNGVEERIGIELGVQLDMAEGRYRTPHVYLTSGYHHEQQFGLIYIDEWGYACGHSISTASKDNPISWEEAFEKLKGSVGLEAIMNAKLRHQRITRKTTFEVRK